MITKWGWKNFELKICKKGGGGGGGAGVVDYPLHMKDWHSMALDHIKTDTLTSSMTDIMNVALGADPYTGEVAYDPDADIVAYETIIAAFATLLAGISEPVDWAALFTQAETSLGAPTPVAAAPDVGAIGNIADIVDVDGISEAEIVADVDAFADQLDDEIATKVLPRFCSGMLNINAVVSSAYPIGESIIEGFRNREVAKHISALRLAAEYKNADIELENEKLHLDVRKTNLGKDISLEQMSTNIKEFNVSTALSNAKAIIAFHTMYLQGSSQMLNFLLSKYTWEEAYMKVVVESKRIKIVAKKEEAAVNLEIDEAAATWDLEVFQHGANLLASIGGGVMVPGEVKGKSTASSAIGGAMMGAAAGAMIGSVVPGLGTTVGAVAGGFLGAASALL